MKFRNIDPEEFENVINRGCQIPSILKPRKGLLGFPITSWVSC
jgi:hypothetical protein